MSDDKTPDLSPTDDFSVAKPDIERNLRALLFEREAEIEQLRAALSDCIHGRKDWMEKAKAALAGKEK